MNGTQRGKKISVVGAGNVGSCIAYTLALSGLAAEIALIDVNPEKAAGEVMDIMQGSAFFPPVRVHSGDYDATRDSDIVIVTAGMGRKPGQSRIDLCQGNVEVIRTIVPPIVEASPNAMFIIVSNPVDILTYAALKLSGLPSSHIIGSGTMLDSARLRSAVASHLQINSHEVQAFVLGEHGDTSMVPWSLTSISGMTMSTFCKINGMKEKCAPSELARIDDEMRKAGASVIQRKGATFYAIALAVRRICEAIIRNAHSLLTVSSLIHGQHGIEDVCLSLPFVIGSQGILREVEISLTRDEEIDLQKSADALKTVLNDLQI